MSEQQDILKQQRARSGSEKRRGIRILVGMAALMFFTAAAIAIPWWFTTKGNNNGTGTDFPPDLTYIHIPDYVCEGLELEAFNQLAGERDTARDYFVNNSNPAEVGGNFDCDFWYSGAEPSGAWLKVSGDLEVAADWEGEIDAWLQEFSVDDKKSVAPPGIYGTAPVSDYPAPERQILDAEDWDIAALVTFPEVAADLNGHDPEGTGTVLALRMADEELHLSFIFERRDIDGTGTSEPEVFAGELIAIANQVRELVRQAG